MMNIYIKNAIVTDPSGATRKTNQVYLRGCEIVLIVLPEMLKHAPMFKRYVCSCLWFVLLAVSEEGFCLGVRATSLSLSVFLSPRGERGGALTQCTPN
jgi:hypothetical protein